MEDFMAEVAPKNGEYMDGKLWFQRKGSVVTIGMTNAAIEELGAVQSIEFPEEGDDFTKNEVVVTVDGSNGRLEVISPATGIVQEVNTTAQQDPDRVTEDPVEEGWLVKLEIEDTSDLQELA